MAVGDVETGADEDEERGEDGELDADVEAGLFDGVGGGGVDGVCDEDEDAGGGEDGAGLDDGEYRADVELEREEGLTGGSVEAVDDGACAGEVDDDAEGELEDVCYGRVVF